MRAIRFILLPAILFVAACEKHPASTSHPSILKVGDVDEKGRPIIYVYEGKRPAPVALESEFGIMMYRDAAHSGTAHFILGRMADKRVFDFANYNDFLKALGELPKQSTIRIHDRCEMPLFYDFYPVHQELKEKFSEDCKRRGLKLDREPKITCTCGVDA